MGMANDFPVVNEGTRTITRTITCHVFNGMNRPDDESYLGDGNSVGLELKTVNGVGIATIIDRNSLFEGLITYEFLWNCLANSEWFNQHPRIELQIDGYIADVCIRGESKVVIQ